MIIKSHVRGGSAAADYLKEYGENEKIRLVQISDPDAKNLTEAFHNMWTLASNTRCTKPLHHISINPMKGEHLTDKQVLKIVERCEQKYGYKPGEHQRVIVEHIKDGRQHFHVMWNRVSLKTGKPVWPGQHWNKSKQAAREMERELGLKRPVPRRAKRLKAKLKTKTATSSNFQSARLSKQLPMVFKLPVSSKTPSHEKRRKTAVKSFKHAIPNRPAKFFSNVTPTAMGAEQRADYQAACEGKITWAQYFRKWGSGGLSL